MALIKDRNTRRRQGELVYFPMKAGAVAYAGGIAVADGGYAKPGAAGANLAVLGRFEESVSNAAGADGGAKVLVRRRGVFLWGNLAADRVGAAHVGGVCYIADDETVAATHNGNARSAAGIVVAVSDDGVWVDVERPKG